MTAPTIAPPDVLRSGARPAARAPKRRGWFRFRRPTRRLEHYDLFDRRGRWIGHIPDAVPRPTVGANYPTLFVIRR